MRLLFLTLIGCQSTSSTLNIEPSNPTEPDVQPIAASTEGARYELDFAARASQYFRVRAAYPTNGRERVTLMMPTWTPGSYLIREYSQHVEHVIASTEDGDPLPIRKLSKNRWEISSKGMDSVHLQYDVYAHNLSVRGNWVEQDLAVLNGAPTFIVDSEHLNRPSYIQIKSPESWASIHTALPLNANEYVAEDLDTLVDSPWLLGETQTYTFTVNDIDHAFINWGEGEQWDGETSAKDVETLTRTIIDFWGEIPYPNYQYLNVLAEARGGLEHKNSTLMLTSRWNTHAREDYLGWLGLVSHEFFHTWNVKRLRPKSLGPFDYEEENYTRSLWIAEGLTSYYDDLLLVRAGLMTEVEYLKRLSKQIAHFQDRPGRFTRSLEDVSFDAWIKHYRSNENSLNTHISYYSKGAIVGWMLDMEIRRQTDGKASLDNVMREAWKRHSGETGFTPEAFQTLCEEIAGVSLESFFKRYVRGTTELDYSDALAWSGLQLPKPEERSTPWLGIETQESGGALRITEIHKKSPAFAADLIVGDELIAVNGFRVRAKNLGNRLKQLNADTGVTLLVTRRGQLREVDISAPPTSKQEWTLTTDEGAGNAAANRRRYWLTGTKP